MANVLDGRVIGDLLRDQSDHDLSEFVDRMLSRLDKRELEVFRGASRSIADIRRRREDSLIEHRAKVAAEKRKQESKEIALARGYEHACAGAMFFSAPHLSGVDRDGEKT